MFDTTINRDSKASNGLDRPAILPPELRDDIYRFVLLGANGVPEIGSRCPPAMLHSISNEIRNDLHGLRLDLNCTHTTFALTCTDGAVRDNAHEWIYGRLRPEFQIPFHGSGTVHTINVTVALARNLPTLRYQVRRFPEDVSPDNELRRAVHIFFS